MMDISGINPVRTSYQPTTGTSSATPAPHQERVSLPVDQVPSIPAPTAEVPQQKQPTADVFVVSDNVFSLYKLPNGQIFSTVRNLRTGEQQVTPSLDAFTFFEAMQGHRGIFVEKDI